MAGLIDVASLIMSRSERQVELAGQNVSNVNTPGYKRRLSFERLINADTTQTGLPFMEGFSIDFTPGKLVTSGRLYDLAIVGQGFFAVGNGQRTVYTRQGQFDRDADGRLVDSRGQALQVEGGGDLRLKSDDVKVLEDGSVLEDGEPVAKLAVVAFDPASARPVNGGYVVADSAVSTLDKPSVRQGSLEASNVSMSAEMVTMMGALRRAETGQRLALVYDDLMGRVLQTVGQST